MSSDVRNTRSGRAGEITNGTAAANTNDASSLDREGVFDVLSNSRRRYAVEYLKKHDEGSHIELSDLVDYIAARENDTSITRVDYKQRKRVYSSLRQSHLPKLQEYDLIEYDKNRGTIGLNDAIREVQMHLEYVPENDIPWCYHYLGLAAVAGGVVVLKSLSVSPFSELSMVPFGTVITVVFGVSAIVHTLYTKRNRLGSHVEVNP